MTTWQIRRGGLARWVFSFPAQAGEGANSCLRRHVPIVMTAVGDLGRIAKVDVSTFDRGEYTYELTGTAIDQLTDILKNEPICAVYLELDLSIIVDEGGEDVWLPDTSFLVLDIDDHSTDGSIGMWFSIDIDIYSPFTWAGTENHALAAINNPRLAGFLARVREAGAILDTIDAEAYEGHIDENGFH